MCTAVKYFTRALLGLLYKENTKLEDWKMYLLYKFAMSSTHLCLRYSSSSKKNYFGCAANHMSADNVASSVLETFLPSGSEREWSEGAKSGE
jgi:hypothetical protein